MLVFLLAYPVSVSLARMHIELHTCVALSRQLSRIRRRDFYRHYRALRLLRYSSSLAHHLSGQLCQRPVASWCIQHSRGNHHLPVDRTHLDPVHVAAGERCCNAHSRMPRNEPHYRPIL